jgi:hypothetical protein
MSAKIGGSLLIALGLGNAGATVAWVDEDGHGLFAPGPLLFVVLLVASAITVGSGVGYLIRKRWATGVSIVGVAILWAAPAIAAVARFGWSNISPVHHVLKLAAYVIILIVPAIGAMLQARRT